MLVAAQYPKPSEETLEKFKKKFGEYYSENYDYFILSGDYVLAICREEIKITVNRGIKDKIKNLNAAKFIGTFKIKTSRLKEKQFIEIDGVKFDTDYLRKIIPVLRKSTSTWIDLWLLGTAKSNGQVDYGVLGIGSKYGFIILACTTKPSNDVLHIEDVITEKKDYSKRKTVEAENTVKVDDKTLKKWMEELEIK